MNEHLRDLAAGLQTGFIHQNIASKEEYQPHLLLNNKELGTKVLSTILKDLNSCEAFWFSVAFLTRGGIATLMNTLEELESRGTTGKVLVSQYLNFTQPEALKALIKFKNIDSRILVNENFHSKGYLFKKSQNYSLIIGSSNLTQNALGSNTELNIRVPGNSQSLIIKSTLHEFSRAFKSSTPIDDSYISQYELVYKKQFKVAASSGAIVTSPIVNITPNKMQLNALSNIQSLRDTGVNKALLVSATGTGKTYLSAFDVKAHGAKKVLFVVHRANIAKAALKTFQSIFGTDHSMGMYSGSNRDGDADFLFCTIQTISREEHLTSFSRNHFDYIIVDETHRAGAATYQKVIDYFSPKFLLGMTATPERTDGYDIYKVFDHNIAYEIRLHHAMEEKMLSPFHYYGVAELIINNKAVDSYSDFNLLVADERVDRIIEKAQFYGCDSGVLRGLVFCSRLKECEVLSQKFEERGLKTIFLSGSNPEQVREDAIRKLESEDPSDKIDYIFTVDIFNEGVDIPKVNQIIMLRPTESAIVFVQQLGRGLRKIPQKEYLTVIDFIGNYQNNYMVPIALYGDTSYNKDSLRKFMVSASSLLPGASTINFDKISRDRIFESIASAKMNLKKDLVQDYKLLKFKIGRNPMMTDFLNHGSRDPQLYVEYSKSYYNFVYTLEGHLGELNEYETKLLQHLSGEINNSKRVVESSILLNLINHGFCEPELLQKYFAETYDHLLTKETIASCINNLNLKFVTEAKDNRKLSLCEIYGHKIIESQDGQLVSGKTLKTALENLVFSEYLLDNTVCAIRSYNEKYDPKKYLGGFILYHKYSRKDVFRILNWAQNPVAQNVGGYIINNDKSNCPIFVNYHKEEDISDTTKYEDHFLNQYEFAWMSKSRRNLNSPDVVAIRNHEGTLRLPLFIKKNNDEGTDFYYMGDMEPIADSFKETSMPTEGGQSVSVVTVKFRLSHAVEDGIYEYITSSIDAI